MLIFVYAVLVFLVLRFSVVLFNFLSNPKLGHYGKHFTDKVSIVISVTDPDQDVAALQESIREQDYGNIEFIFKTSEYDGHSIAARTTGAYLLFLDAGTVINKGLINNLIYRTKVFELSLLSLIPTSRFNGVKDFMVIPLTDFMLITIFPLRLTRVFSQQANTIVNESCMFFTRDGYNHRLRDETAKLKTEVLLANRFVYATGQNANQPGQRLLQLLGNNPWIALVYLVLVIAGPVMMWLNYNLAFMALPLGLIFLSRVMISFLTAQNPLLNVLLHPLQMVYLLVLLLKASWNKLFYTQ